MEAIALIYVYRNSSKSATSLADAIKDEGCEVIRWKHLEDHQPKKADLVVNWGAYVGHWPGSAEVLNRSILGDKFRELVLMTKAGVPTVYFSTQRPSFGKWIARKYTHYEADDVRAELVVGDYYTKWYDIDKEFRFHVFKGQVLQTQFKKAVKPDAHNWIRSWASGWDWKNGSDGAPSGAAAASIKAVAAVGYDFGAVDVGRLAANGSFVVLEVNSSPGFDLGGTTCYKWANAIIEAAKE
jgi:hypothetical protein